VNGYAWIPSGEGNEYDPSADAGYAEYVFELPEAGDYVIWGRVLAPHGGDDSFFVSIDSGDYALWDTEQSSTWVWDQVKNRGGPDPVVYYLEAGEHVLTIAQREDGTKIDRILITNDLGYVPEGLGGEGTLRIWLEAEEGYLEIPMESNSDGTASAGEYIWVPNGGGSGGKAEYTFEIPLAGDYVIWGRVLAPDGGDDSFFVSIDDGDYSLWDTRQSSTWVWDKVRNRGGPNPVVYYLEAGEHVLTIGQREDGTRIDRILITDDLGYVPEGLGDGGTVPPTPVNIWLEAEDGYVEGPMALGSDENASAGEYIWVPNGGGFGGEAEYTFEVPETGDYVIWGRVLAINGVDDSFFVSVDDGDLALWDTRIGETWLWDQVNNRGGPDPVVYYLEAGEHVLTIGQREDGTKIDRILITNDLGFFPAD